MLVRLKQPTELKGDTTMKNNITSKQACTIAHQIRRETGCSLADAFKAAYAGNNTVNPKTSWTAEDLNKIFSDKAAELLRKGYIIDAAAMSGHQGEISKIVFRKDGCWYALVMESQNTFGEGKYSDKYVIWFGKYTEDISNMHLLDSWNTPWLNKFEASWSLEFIKITNNYFVTAEEAKSINEKCHNRYKNRYDGLVKVIDNKYYKYILPAVRAQKGCKSLKISNILEVKRVPITSWTTDEITGRYYKVITDKTDKAGRPVVIDIRFKSNNK